MTSPDGYLLDSSLLIALVVDDHEHHGAAVQWFESHYLPTWTCPITQGALLRVVMRLSEGTSFRTAQEVLQGIVAHPRHRFLADDLPYERVTSPVIGPGQVTDAYLVALAAHHELLLATLDRAQAKLAAQHSILVG